MANAARVNDFHICPLTTGTVPHVGGTILPSSNLTVFVEGSPAARMGDMAICTGPPDTILQGSATVFIENIPAARLGDATAHGGTITMGAASVFIGG